MVHIFKLKTCSLKVEGTSDERPVTNLSTEGIVSQDEKPCCKGTLSTGCSLNALTCFMYFN
jgi:hypothetical protein